MDKLQKFWASLPHPMQAVIVTVASAGAAAFVHAASEGGCYSGACLKHYAATAAAAALGSLRVFYMLPNTNPPKPAEVKP